MTEPQQGTFTFQDGDAIGGGALARGTKVKGHPDGVGMPMHRRATDEDPPVPKFVAYLERLLALDVEVVLLTLAAARSRCAVSVTRTHS